MVVLKMGREREMECIATRMEMSFEESGRTIRR